ncbi:MAG: hypothetical protein ACT4OX_14090 [Actinomycetota bacterium]
MSSPRDEQPHDAGPEQWWSDAWQLDAASADGIGLTVRLECYPNQGRAWYWTYFVLPDLSGPVVVRDHEVLLPRQGLEIRAEGLWAELWCETAFEHWTFGLEAFGLRLDDPEDGRREEIGERMPLGLDLEWERTAPLHAHGAHWPIAGYVGAGRVHGDVLLGRARYEFDACGEYHRTWGVRDWGRRHWSFAAAADDVALHVEGCDEAVDGFVWRGGQESEPVEDARAEISRRGAARLVLDERLEIDVDAIARAPVPIGDGVVLERALCRFAFDGLAADGWSAQTAAV